RLLLIQWFPCVSLARFCHGRSTVALGAISNDMSMRIMMRRLLHLDGLRGWAALFVIFHHLELAFLPAIKGPNDGVSPILGPLSFLTDGPLAVSIFFLLSGIVLAEAVEAALRRSGPAKVGLTGLVIKRWLRLGLPIIVTGLLILTLFVSVGNHT